MARKRYVRWTVEDAVEVVKRHGVISVADAAAAVGVSRASARRHLDGGVDRGELIRDEYDADGHRLHFEHWRYAAAADA